MSVVATFVAVAVAALPTGGTLQPNVVVQERFGVSVEKAITYEQSAVPQGSRAVVAQWLNRDGTTTIDLAVKGLERNRTYGAHVHSKPCGADPEAAGGHYQNRVDPVQPSVDPAYANRRNEVWLDFTTDARGDADSRTTVDWRFRTGQARSVIIHEHATMTHPGHAGMAGSRLACINVPFD